MKICTPLNPLLITLVLLILAPTLTFAAENPWERKLPFKYATIKYEITGMETGTEVLYIKDYGKFRALHHDGTTSMFGMTTRNRHLEITDPDWHYTFDLEAKTGTKVTNPSKFYQEEYDKLSAAEKQNVDKNAKELGISMLGDLNGQVEENATEILGYSCDRTTVMGMTINLIHGTDIPLLSDMNIMGMRAKSTATSIDTDKPPADAFALPVGITPQFDQNADAAARQMAVSTINTLKEPDGAEKMRTKMMSERPQDNPALMDDGDREMYQETEPDSDFPTGSSGEDSNPSEEDQDMMNKSMQQGMEMLKGLFGN